MFIQTKVFNVCAEKQKCWIRTPADEMLQPAIVSLLSALQSHYNSLQIIH